MCETIYLVNTQQTYKKVMDVYLSDILRFFNNVQKSYSFSAHFEQHFDAGT